MNNWVAHNDDGDGANYPLQSQTNVESNGKTGFRFKFVVYSSSLEAWVMKHFRIKCIWRFPEDKTGRLEDVDLLLFLPVNNKVLNVSGTIGVNLLNHMNSFYFSFFWFQSLLIF